MNDRRATGLGGANEGRNGLKLLEVSFDIKSIFEDEVSRTDKSGGGQIRKDTTNGSKRDQAYAGKDDEVLSNVLGKERLEELMREAERISEIDNGKSEQSTAGRQEVDESAEGLDPAKQEK